MKRFLRSSSVTSRIRGSKMVPASYTCSMTRPYVKGEIFNMLRSVASDAPTLSPDMISFTSFWGERGGGMCETFSHHLRLECWDTHTTLTNFGTYVSTFIFEYLWHKEWENTWQLFWIRYGFYLTRVRIQTQLCWEQTIPDSKQCHMHISSLATHQKSSQYLALSQKAAIWYWFHSCVKR